MARIPDDVLRDIADRIGIEAVVSQHVTLRRRGSSLVGLCPFHDEKTPSFHVMTSRQVYHCFGCSAHGDVFSFIMNHEGRGFLDVVADLAERAGVELPTEELSPEDRARQDRRSHLLHLMEVACSYYERSLRSEAGSSARDHLKERDLPPEIVGKARVGAAPERTGGLSTLAAREGFGEQDLLDAGLTVRRDSGRIHERFRSRLMFPIRDLRGKVVGFGGRALDDHPAKYMNSPESTLYRKSQILYGMYEARPSIQRAERVVVVEGYFDRLALATAGIRESVATCGTALTSGQLQIMRRLSRRVILLYDADEAGQTAAVRSLALFLEADLWPLVATIPDGKDPDDYLRSHGADALREVLDAARPLVDLALDRAENRYRGDSLFAERFMADVVGLLSQLSPINRQVYAAKVASTTGLREELVLRRFETARRGQKRNQSRPQRIEASPPQVGRAPEEEIFLVVAALMHPNSAIPEIARWRGPAMMATQELADLLERLLRAHSADEAIDAASWLRALEAPHLSRQVSEKLMAAEDYVQSEFVTRQVEQVLQRLRCRYLKDIEKKLRRELSISDNERAEELLGQHSAITAELSTLNNLISGHATASA